MLRIARTYVMNQATAEDVVQDTWLVVLNGVNCFDGRSSLKTWIYRILTNRAETAGQRERRCVADVVAAINLLPLVVITLRDVECWTATEVCNALELSQTNQRVLLHRARSKVRTGTAFIEPPGAA